MPKQKQVNATKLHVDSDTFKSAHIKICH